MNGETPVLIKEFNIKSNKNNEFSLKFYANSNLLIKISSVNKLPQIYYEKSFSVEIIKQNKYFSICDNMSDIILAFEFILKDEKNIILKEEFNYLKLLIKIPHPKCPEIIFDFQNSKIDINDSIYDLYEMINKLKNEIIEKEKEYKKEKDELKREIEELKEELRSKSCIDNDFKELFNSWTNEIINTNEFLYTLKDNNYLAEKTKENQYIYKVKSYYQLKLDKIYKIEYKVNYTHGGDFHIGFASSSGGSWLKSNDSVAITNEGLFINNININQNLLIENGKKYQFIINISKKYFTININGLNAGEFYFNFQNNIFAQAAIRHIGNSVSIRSYEKDI